MRRILARLLRDDQGAAMIETAFALPVLVVFIYGIFQFGQLMEADAGAQNALGQGARYATLCLHPAATTGACTVPSDTEIQGKITAGLFGMGSGTWATPTIATSSGYKTITVTYSQNMNFLLFSGPTLTLTRSKKVYTAPTS